LNCFPVPPKIVEVSGKTNAIEGSEISVVCQAEGLPDPEFQFYKVWFLSAMNLSAHEYMVDFTMKLLYVVD